MPERYIEAILKYLAERDYRPLKQRQVARQMGIADGDYGAFREAVKRLRDAGRIVLGERDALTLPPMPSRVVGFLRANAKGFGFVVPETPNAHGDLYIPSGAAGGAMNGDLVVARVKKRRKRAGQLLCAGIVVKILQRGQNRFVGELIETEGTWFVLPDGKGASAPIVVPDVSAAGPRGGTKVVVEIVRYGQQGDLPSGVIVETLGEKGQLEVETLSVIRAHGLPERFSDAALAESRQAVEAFDGAANGRQDITDLTVITIDPPDARDFDDAISLTTDGDGRMTLGVHIADVSHFVREGGRLDAEAKERATSAYFPRKVLPMLPEVLSNGVCSLQQGQRRYAKSVFITYDAQANVVAKRAAETVICSSKRLTYTQAQSICDGKDEECSPAATQLLRDLAKLSRLIEARRRQAGMLQLDLPEVELLLDEAGRVADVVPADESYTHTMIEMFMVEANEAASEILDRADRPHLRRVHGPPDPSGAAHLRTLVRACGHRLPTNLSRRDMQQLLEAVRGQPESYAVNLALLRTFQQAEYSPMEIGHFALASNHYCHFTSPIRRYPDLTVHRLMGDYCRGRGTSRPGEDLSDLTALGEHCTAGEKRAEAAESELRDVLVLQLLAGKVGEGFRGVITGVTNFGIFVQSRKYLVEGLVRLDELGDDWWEVSARYGRVVGQRSGRRFCIGDMIDVRIAGVDVARRQLNLVPEPPAATKGKRRLKAKPR